ncbi:MAG: transferrin-binding protein-like solute binding protein [Pseudomonadota bacterium]
MSYTFKPIALSLLTCALQACSSGSSGGFSSGGASGFTGTVSATGSAIAADTTTNPSDGSIAFADAAPTAGPLLEFDVVNDQLTEIRVSDSEVDIVLDLTDPDTRFATLPDGLAIATPDLSAVAIFGAEPRITFEHQTFGAWMAGPTTGSGTAGAGTFGDPTPTSNAPINIGVYRGIGTGIYQTDDGDVFVTSNNFNVSIRPAEDRLTISSNNTVGVNVATGEEMTLNTLNFNFGFGVLSGITFTADVADLDDRTGTATGTFYGPNAEELGGVFQVKDATSSHIGAFGTERITAP